MHQENSQEEGCSGITGLALRPTTVWSWDWPPDSKANIVPLSSYSFPFEKDLFVGFFLGGVWLDFIYLCIYLFLLVLLKKIFNSFTFIQFLKVTFYLQLLQNTGYILCVVQCIFFFNWNIVDLQCCIGFRCTAQWFSYTYIYIYFFQILFPYRLLQNIEYSSLCYTVGPCWLSILYIVGCIC